MLGAQGKAIKTVRMQAAQEMESALGKKVDLFLFVKVREDWQQNQDIINTINY